MEVEKIVDHLKNNDTVKATTAFQNAMAEKLTAALDAKKVDLASTLIDRKTVKDEE